MNTFRKLLIQLCLLLSLAGCATAQVYGPGTTPLNGAQAQNNINLNGFSITNGAFAGNGAGLTNLPGGSGGSGVSSGGLITNVSIVQATNNQITASNFFTTNGGSFNGNAAGLTNLQCSNLVGTITTNITGNASLSNLSVSVAASVSALTVTNTVTATNAPQTSQFAGTFTGNGSGLTNIPLTGLTAAGGHGQIVSNDNGTLVLANSPSGSGPSYSGGTNIVVVGTAISVSQDVITNDETADFTLNAQLDVSGEINANSGNMGLFGPSGGGTGTQSFFWGSYWENQSSSTTFGLEDVAHLYNTYTVQAGAQDITTWQSEMTINGDLTVNTNLSVLGQFHAYGPISYVGSTSMGLGITNTTSAGFTGNAAGLTNLQGSNIVGAISNATFIGSTATFENWEVNMTNESGTGNGSIGIQQFVPANSSYFDQVNMGGYGGAAWTEFFGNTTLGNEWCIEDSAFEGPFYYGIIYTLHGSGVLNVNGTLIANNNLIVTNSAVIGSTSMGLGITNTTSAGFTGNAAGLTNLNASSVVSTYAMVTNTSPVTLNVTNLTLTATNLGAIYWTMQTNAVVSNILNLGTGYNQFTVYIRPTNTFALSWLGTGGTNVNLIGSLTTNGVLLTNCTGWYALAVTCAGTNWNTNTCSYALSAPNH